MQPASWFQDRQEERDREIVGSTRFVLLLLMLPLSKSLVGSNRFVLLLLMLPLSVCLPEEL